MVRLRARVLGTGVTVVFVHGSGGGADAWQEQEPLAERHRLVLVDRRGYGKSPPAERIDFETDGEDLAGLIGEMPEPRVHLYGGSSGGIGAMLAAARVPGRILSLAVTEPPVLSLSRCDEAKEFVKAAREVYDAAPRLTPEEFAVRFYAVLGWKQELQPRLEPAVRASVEAIMKERPPFDAALPFDALRAARFPKLVISGSWHRGFEEACDEIARQIGAERVALEAGGHAVRVSAKDGFNRALEEFWRRAETS